MFSSTRTTHSGRTSSLDVSRAVRVLDPESFWVKEKGEWSGDESQDESDDHKGRKELFVDDTGGQTDIQDNDLDKTEFSIEI